MLSSSRTIISSLKSVDFDFMGLPLFLLGTLEFEDKLLGLDKHSSVMDCVLPFFFWSFFIKLLFSGDSNSLTELSLEAKGGENS